MNIKEIIINNYSKKDSNNEPKPQFINSLKKEINNDVRIISDENDSKHNYNYNYSNKNKYYNGKGKENDEFGPPKFYCKIKTNNNDRENRPKKNYNDVEKQENEDGKDYEKPRFVNSKFNGFYLKGNM